ncbi:MAG: hypothetical protein ISP99_01075 [Pseudomonadales bacterium]|nr:hypothetical protein [Pseudomonadales bacterium]MBL6813742.1 hypothetical protein [Pseudomonadales bacterium]
MTQSSRNLFLIWSGLIVGVSLLATPAKFLAPDLGLTQALQVGRVTFQVMACAELILLAISIIIVVLNLGSHWRDVKWSLVIAALLAVQYLGVLPLLSSYTDQIFNGRPSGAPSHLHSLYVLIELIKLGLLLALGLRPSAKNSSYALSQEERL